MNKPNWKDAPKWARWLAQDYDGLWCWFQYKPKWCFECQWWDVTKGGDHEIIKPDINIGACETLEKKP